MLEQKNVKKWDKAVCAMALIYLAIALFCAIANLCSDYADNRNLTALLIRSAVGLIPAVLLALYAHGRMGRRMLAAIYGIPAAIALLSFIEGITLSPQLRLYSTLAAILNVVPFGIAAAWVLQRRDFSIAALTGVAARILMQCHSLWATGVFTVTYLWGNEEHWLAASYLLAALGGFVLNGALLILSAARGLGLEE